MNSLTIQIMTTFRPFKRRFKTHPLRQDVPPASSGLHQGGGELLQLAVLAAEGDHRAHGVQTLLERKNGSAVKRRVFLVVKKSRFEMVFNLLRKKRGKNIYDLKFIIYFIFLKLVWRFLFLYTKNIYWTIHLVTWP